jgi:hypothetical protein
MSDINKTFGPIIITIAMVTHLYMNYNYPNETANQINYLLFFILYALCIIIALLIDISDRSYIKDDQLKKFKKDTTNPLY